MYLFISIIFIAELIISLTLINLIIKADRRVCEINQCIDAFNPLVLTCMQYARCLVSNFNSTFKRFYAILRKKKELIIYRTIVMITIYAFLFLFKIRMKKASKIYKLIGAIRDLAVEIAI